MHQHHPERSARRAREAQPQNPISRLAVSLSLGLLCGTGTAVILLLLVAAILTSAADPARLVIPSGVAILLLSSLVTGFAAQKLYRGGRLFPVGPSIAALWVLTVYLLSLAAGATDTIYGTESALSSVYAAAVRILSCALVILGAFLALRCPQNQVRTRRSTAKRR